MKRSVTSILLSWVLLMCVFPAGWQAGLAKVVITPQESLWMAGFAARTKPSEGTLHDLYAKAIVIEDSTGNRALLITTDLIGFPKGMSDRIRKEMEKKYGLDRSRIILSSSHTHSGPVLSESLIDIYPFDEDHYNMIQKYSDDLEKKLIILAGKAIKSMKPVKLYSGMGTVRFQVNRRNNTEAVVNSQTELKGPNEYSVPVFKVTDEKGKLITVIFGYSCHPTVLSIYEFSGDYPGFAQIELEKIHPGTTAMFFQATGADQNPLPRKTVPLAQQYGRELAYAVERVLNEDMNELEPALQTAYSEIDLPFTSPPGRDSLITLEKNLAGWQQRWAVNQRKSFEKNGALPTSYPYPLQVWKLGGQLLFVMGGEVVIQYSIDLKKRFGQNAFVMGYSNDVMNYIPSEVILNEGGYEGSQAKMVYGLPADWAPGIEERILNGFEELALKINITRVNQ